MAVTSEFVKPALGSRPFDQKLAVAYYLAAIFTLSFYGTRVCPFVDSLDPLIVVATFAVIFGSTLLLKLVFEERIMPPDDPFSRSVTQFFLDAGLFAGAGLVLSLIHI